MKKIILSLIILFLCSACSFNNKTLPKEEKSLISSGVMSFKGCYNYVSTIVKENVETIDIIKNMNNYKNETMSISDETIYYCKNKFNISVECKSFNYYFNKNHDLIFDTEDNDFADSYVLGLEKNIFSNFLLLTESNEENTKIVRYNNVECENNNIKKLTTSSLTKDLKGYYQIYYTEQPTNKLIKIDDTILTTINIVNITQSEWNYYFKDNKIYYGTKKIEDNNYYEYEVKDNKISINDIMGTVLVPIAETDYQNTINDWIN